MNFIERYGPWALVTGASSGIGEQFARQLAQRGINLVISARREQRLQALAAELSASCGIEALYLPLDLTQSGAVTTLLEAGRGKDLGLVVCNAGFGLKGLHQEQDAEALRDMLQVNINAPTLLSNGFADQLSARGRGGLILTGSIEGFQPFPYSAAYAASKAYVLSLGESLAWELKRSGIDVMVLCPGSTDTEALALQGFDAADLKGLMSPEDVTHQALTQLGHQTVYVPGLTNRLMRKLLALLPRKVAISAVAAGLQAAMRR